MRNSMIGALAFALLWAVLAARSPETTFHLGPVIVAAWPVLSTRGEAAAGWLLSIGLGLALVSTGVLAVAGFLQGPSLLPVGGAAIESLVGAGLGTVIGVGARLVRNSVAVPQT